MNVRNAPAVPQAAGRWPVRLLTIFALIWLALAIRPHYRADWLLESVLVLLALPWLVWSYRTHPFTDAAYACLFVFLVLHQVGAHFTYAEVPYDAWAQSLFGVSVSDTLGWSRNHYDRLVHFLYGLLVTPIAVELIDRRVSLPGAWRWLLPWTFVVSHSTIFELLEAAAAGVFGGDLGQAYLGTQGDEWDAQRDSALAAVGAAITVTVLRIRGRGAPARPPSGRP
jgi:putative membrane protein